jgi:ATP-binding cassette subfamily B protein/subfamily B ATP-binding cassette protein MsbA
VAGSVVLTSAVSLAQPWPVKILVDNVLGDRPRPAALDDLQRLLPGPDTPAGLIVWLAVATLLIFGAATLLEMVSTVVATRVGQRMTWDLGSAVFGHLQRLSLVFHGRRPVGDTIARVTGDTFGAETLFRAVLTPVLQAIVTLVAMFAIMWALSPPLTLLALCVVPFQLGAIWIFGRPMRRRSRERLDIEGRLMSQVQQNLNAVPAVQAFTREDLEHRHFAQQADSTVRAYVRETRASMWFKLFAGAATAVGTAGIMYLGARYAVAGQVTAGTIIVFLAYLASLYEPLDSIAYTASTYQICAAQTDRVLELMQTRPDVEDAPDARAIERARGHVAYRAVTFAYEPGTPVLEDVSLEARPGEVVAIVGRTGAGKTTLVNLLMRFFDPQQGQLTLDGHDLRSLRVADLRRQVAMVLQEPFIFPLSVADNIAYGRQEASREEVVDAARAANAHDFVSALPEGYDTVVGERGATLSGGEKQRLSIARAFVKDAPILVLDEPTSALDAKTEAALLDALSRLSRNRTSFIIAHRLSTIRDADRIVVLDEGRVVEQGGHQELLAARGAYASLYAQQTDLTRHEDGDEGGGGHAGRGRSPSGAQGAARA